MVTVNNPNENNNINEKMKQDNIKDETMIYESECLRRFNVLLPVEFLRVPCVGCNTFTHPAFVAPLQPTSVSLFSQGG